MLLSSLKTRLLLSKLAVMLFVSNSVFAAATVNPATEPLNSIAPYGLSNTNLSSGTVKAYRPYFENGAWQGDLVQYNVSTGGVLTTTVDLTPLIPTTTDGGNWDVRIQFNAKAATWWDTGRKIIFHNGTNQAAFRWDNLSDAQKTALPVPVVPEPDTLDADAVLNFIRGDQSNEIVLDYETNSSSGVFRSRFNLMGDIIHSNPVYIGAPSEDFSLRGYSSYKTQDIADGGQADRAGRVYVGANDGMLHVFDAATGNEVYAYIPSMVIGNLAKLAADPFTHNYFVDGELSGGDADFDADLEDEVTDWHTMLVGGLGSGGKGLFALDVTNPDLSAEVANTGTDSKILWEIDDAYADVGADIGYIHGKAQIARLPDGNWYVFSGNGYNSANGRAKLLLITPGGTVTAISPDDSILNNGLSAPTLVNINNDDAVDYGFAGDLKGNLWKFDFTAAPTITVTPLYAAGVNKPITTAPDVTRHPYGGLLVIFGTGSLLSEDDRTNEDPQSIYGIWDRAASPIVEADLLTQTLGSAEYEYGTSPDITTLNTRTNTNNDINWSTHKGWKVDLNITGERLVNDPIVRAGRVQMTTHNPSAGADGAGDAWLLELNYLNGGTGSKIFFDLNADENINNADLVNDTIPVGVNLGAGSYSGPQIARVSQVLDTMFINGLYLPVTPGPNGFDLGDVIVDTDGPNGGSTASTATDSHCYFEGNRGGDPVDSNGDPVVSPATPVVRPGKDGAPKGLGGKTDGSHAAYDKAHGVTYIDYINIEPLCNQPRADDGGTNDLNNINRITETVSDYTKKFFIILGNADLSAGGELTIGSKTWNVVDYQIMIEKQLKLFENGTTASLVDDAGDSLLFNINDILAGGQLRLSFKKNALPAGGMLPTDPSCVSPTAIDTYGGTGDPKSNKGRWRGGALYIQAIDWVDFTTVNNGTPYSQVVEQDPTDLMTMRTIDGQPKYLIDGAERYGGLRASSSDIPGAGEADATAFLYESTVFWDYGKGSCYGTANWQADSTGAGNSSINTSLKNLLVPLELDLDQAKALLIQMENDGITGQKLTKQQELVAKLQQKIDEIKASLEEESIVNTGVPVSPTDATPELSPSLGPNFRTGRRTWIDLTP